MERGRKRKYEDRAQVINAALAERAVMHGTIHQLLHCILSYLPAVDVCRLSRVCREWNTVAHKNQLWKEICQRDRVDLQQLTQALPDFDEQRHCYKSLFKEYALPIQKWTTGKGVTKVCKHLKHRADFLAISSQHIFTRDMSDFTHRRPDSCVYVFVASTGAYLHELAGLTGRPAAVCVSEDGTKAAAHCFSFVVLVWNVHSGQCIYRFGHPNGGTYAIRIHDAMLAVGFHNVNRVFLWSIETGQRLHQLQCVHGLNTADVLVMDGQHVAVHDKRAGVVQLCDVNTATHLFTWTQTGYCSQMLLDCETKSLLGCCYDAVMVWDTEMGICRARIEKCVVPTMLIHDGHLIIHSCRTQRSNFASLQFVDVQTCSFLDSVNVSGPRNERKLCAMVGVSNRLLLLVYADRPNDVHVCDVRKRQMIRTIETVGEGQSQIVAVNSSLQQLQIVLKNVHEDLNYVTYDFTP